MDAWTALLFGLVPIVAADSFFPSVPAEVAVATGGSLASEGRGNLALVILLSAVGSWLGDAALYLLVKHSLSPLVDRWRWGRRLHSMTREGLEELGRSGAFIMVLGARFLPGGRLASCVTAGITRMPTRAYLASDAIGGVLWSAWMAGIGFVAHTATDLPFWESAFIGAGISTALALAVGGVLSRRARRRRAALHAESTTSADGR
ncbi:VTT domain-containing protein [Sinomonas sp. JGH33]|uniref:VTT domain-containing protein n=1 Tax=Sinomonas terricola TaxID=3110330 RepID=A0ABU5T728_9MICC|nr:VTT domain-containing protein [Sinomonas sp. JGH33]MEA5455393.1 VTT domain-containing protein [Sinomonas sp. JGH33]